jgi:hypothetical protein
MASSTRTAPSAATTKRPWMFAAAGSCLAIVCMVSAAGGLWLFVGGSPSRSSPASSAQEPPAEIDSPPGEIDPALGENPDLAETPIMTPEIVAASGLLLEDHFEDPANTAVPLFGPESMEFEIVDGAGLMTAHNAGLLAAMYDSPPINDFVATLEFLVPAPAAGAGYGMVFRSDDAPGGLAHFYLVLVSPGDGNVVLSRLDTGGVKELARVPYTGGSDGEISMVTRAQGGEFEVEVNGEILVNAQDSAPLGPGIFGLAMLSPLNGDLVIVQSFEVRAP